MVDGNLVLANHPVNLARIKAGKPPANAIWLWGQGKAPSVPKFVELHRLKGAIISAVDLVRGVGVLAGWDSDRRPGRDRLPRHRLRRQRPVRVEALENHDIVCVHVEAPDEASHEGRHQAKVEALERIDRDDRRPAPQALGVLRSMADPDLARPLDLAANPRPRPRAGGLGDGRHRAARSGKSYDEARRQRRARAVLRPGLSPDGTVPRPELGWPRMRLRRASSADSRGG